jgi:hypothetical protein
MHFKLIHDSYLQKKHLRDNMIHNLLLDYSKKIRAC